MTKAMHRIQRKNKFLPYLLTLPSMLLFSMFTFYPFLKTIALSFFLTDKRGNPTKWAGISNWVRVLSKETFWKIIAITLKIAGINLVFTFGLAIFFALLSSQKKKGGKLYQTMYALPMAIASSPAAAIFLFIFRQKNGVINSLLGGANIGWTTEMPYAMWAVCIMTIWMNVGISYIFLLVGFRAVPQDLIESAYLDGAGVWARIWHVMLPMAIPADILRSVLEHCDLFPQLRTDQIADRRWTCQCNQEPLSTIFTKMRLLTEGTKQHVYKQSFCSV